MSEFPFLAGARRPPTPSGRRVHAGTHPGPGRTSTRDAPHDATDTQERKQMGGHDLPSLPAVVHGSRDQRIRRMWTLCTRPNMAQYTIRLDPP